MKNDSFDNSIRQKLSSHEAPVPANAWENIQKGKRKRRPSPFFWIFAGLLLCGGAGFLLYKNNEENKTVVAEKKSYHQKKEPIAVKPTPAQGKENAAANEATPEKGSNAKLFSPENNNNTTTNNLVKNTTKKDHNSKPAISSTSQNDNAVIDPGKKNMGNAVVKNRFQFNDDNITSDNKKATAKKKKHSADGKSAITITVPQTNEDNLAVVEEVDNSTSVTKDEETSLGKKEIVVPAEKAKEDTVKEIVATETKIPTPKSAKKKTSAGLEIDFSLSGFIPVKNGRDILSMSRTMETPMHKAEFTADKVQIRLQPSAGFNLVLVKKLSSKISAGAGLSYTAIKEYIDLSGEEINTRRTVVQRLHNGNSLVSDTVTTITRGTRNINAVNSYTFLSVPVAVRYQLMNRNQWTLDVSVGLDINLQSKYKNSIGGVLVPQFSGAGHTERNRSIGTGFNGGLRLGRSLGKHYLVYASPYFQVNPKKLYLQQMPAPVTIHRAGLLFGISYRL